MYSGKKLDACFGVIISIIFVSICSDANLSQPVHHEKLKLIYALDAQESTVILPGRTHKFQCVDTIIALPEVIVTWQKDGVVVGKKIILSDQSQSNSTSRTLSKRSLRKKRRANRSPKPSPPLMPSDLTPGAKPQNNLQLPQLSNFSTNFSRHLHTSSTVKQRYTIYNNGVLQITNVDASFQGVYQCFVTDSFGKLLRRKFHLSLAEIPQCSINPPRQMVRIGSATRLNCSAKTLLNVSYTWFKDEKPLPQNKSNKKYVFLSTGVLQIHDVTFSDAGSYRCVVKNKMGESSSKTAEIIVTQTGNNASIKSMVYKPQSLTLSPNNKFAVFECMANDLFCGEFGMRAVTGWNKTNGKVCELEERLSSSKICHKLQCTGYLLLTNLSKKDIGQYNCIMRCRSADKSHTSHDMMTISSAFLDILEKPIITDPPVLQTFPNRKEETKYVPSGSLSISCFASGKPKPQLRWLKDGEIIKIDDHHHSIEDLIHLDQGYRLRISRLRTYDDGYYQCLAENEFGGVSAAVRLELDIRDRIPLPTDLNATEVTATTIRMQWIKPNMNRTVNAYIVDCIGQFGDEHSLNTKETTITLHELHPYSWYTIEVIAYAGNAQNESEVYRVQTMESAPSGVVKNMTYAVVNDTTIIFLWQSLPLKERNGIITRYTINCASEVNGNVVARNIEVPARHLEEEAWNYVLIAGLNPGDTYGISVNAETKVNRGPESKFTNLVMPPMIDYNSTLCRDLSPPVKSFHGKFISAKELQVSWSLVKDSQVKNIKIEIFAKNVLQYSKLLPIATNTTVYERANSSQPYVVRIQPLCYDDGLVCYQRSFAVLPSQVPDPSRFDPIPSNLKAWAMKPDCVLANWTCDNPRNMSYVIRYTVIQTKERKFKVDIVKSSTTICGLEPWTEYEFAVAVQTAGVAIEDVKFDSFGVMVLTSEKTPGIPRNLECLHAPYLLGSAECDWLQPTNPNGEIVGYHVYYKEFSAQEWTTTNVKGNSVRLHCLRSARSYKVKVDAENSVGIGHSTAEVTLTTISYDDNGLLTSDGSVCAMASEPPPISPKEDSKNVAIIVGVFSALLCLVICVLLLVFCFPTSRCVHEKRFKCCQKIRGESPQVRTSRKEGIVKSTKNGVSLLKPSVQVVIDQNGGDQRDRLLSGNGKISESDKIHGRKNGYKVASGKEPVLRKKHYHVGSQNANAKTYVPVKTVIKLDGSVPACVGNAKNQSQNNRSSFPVGNFMRTLTREKKKPVSESDKEIQNQFQMPLLSIPIPRHSTSTSLSSVLLPTSVPVYTASSKSSEALPLSDIKPLLYSPISNGTGIPSGTSCSYKQEAL